MRTKMIAKGSIFIIRIIVINKTEINDAKFDTLILNRRKQFAKQNYKEVYLKYNRVTQI